MTDADLLKEIEAQRLLMIAVATGLRDTDDWLNEEYMLRRERIDDALRERGLDHPNPYADLWSWGLRWSSGDLPKHRLRREYVTELYKPLMDLVRSGRATLRPEPTGWAKVDEIMRDVAVDVAKAQSEHDHQGVGLLCREALIALADAVHDPARHPPTDDKTPSKTDAKRRLDAYLAVELPGNGNEEVRRAAKAAVDLANAVQHRQGATLRDAALVAEATNAVINLIAIIAGRREKPLESIREELAGRLARAEAEAAEWKRKHDAIVGFSTSATLEGDVSGTQCVHVIGSQEFDVTALDYCLITGMRLATDEIRLHGRDVRVPIAHSFVEATFRRGFPGTGPHRLDVILRVRLRAGEMYKADDVSARIEQDIMSGATRLIG